MFAGLLFGEKLVFHDISDAAQPTIVAVGADVGRHATNDFLSFHVSYEHIEIEDEVGDFLHRPDHHVVRTYLAREIVLAVVTFIHGRKPRDVGCDRRSVHDLVAAVFLDQAAQLVGNQDQALALIGAQAVHLAFLTVVNEVEIKDSDFLSWRSRLPAVRFGCMRCIETYAQEGQGQEPSVSRHHGFPKQSAACHGVTCGKGRTLGKPLAVTIASSRAACLDNPDRVPSNTGSTRARDERKRSDGLRHARRLRLSLTVGLLGTWMKALHAVAFGLVSAAAVGATCLSATGAEGDSTQPAASSLEVPLLLARELRDVPPPLSLLDIAPADNGVAGAKLAVADNNTTGRFLNQHTTLDIVENAKPEALIADVLAKIAEGRHFVVVDASASTLLALADATKGRDVVLFNAAAPDDDLREENCRANVMHTAPARSMLTDALGQYLVWKKWTKWFLIAGTLPSDKAYADQLRRTAKRFGATIVEERTFAYDSGSRRSDGGFEQVQQQIPTFTQNAKPHDVVVVADEGELFGEYLPYRTWDPRPVAGTAGLTATPWHPALELWGGTQFQNRFKRLANRQMNPLDYNMWLAVRAVGEAAARTKSGDFKQLVAYMRSKEFELAGFKGVKTTFREWNGQLRQPLLVATPKLLVSVSPQQGFLHQFTELDTLGYDRPETKCKAYLVN